jgi:hypothetical protein
LYGENCVFGPNYVENRVDGFFQVGILDDVIVYMGCLGDLFGRNGKPQSHVTLCGVPSTCKTVGKRVEIGWSDKDQ